MRKLCWIAALFLIGLHDFSPPPSPAQEVEERAPRPGTAREILASTGAFEQAVNGKALVRNRCRIQGNDNEIEEAAEVIKRDGCHVVLRARKVTRAANSGKQLSKQQEIEFTVYADFSELTTPVLVETQKYGQCETTGSMVLKVSSRSEPGKSIQVIRRSQETGAAHDPGLKQTRRDLSLFFSDPAAAEKARKALERAVKSCGGNEWPDEDDLP
jgi:hypothetical protein